MEEVWYYVKIVTLVLKYLLKIDFQILEVWAT